MKRTLIAALSIATALSTLATPGVLRADGPEANVQLANLTGGWVVTVEPDPASGIPAFRELVSFSSDGNILVVDDNAPAPPFPFTYGVGVWERVSRGPGSVWHATFHYLLYDPSTFASAGTATVHRTLRIEDGDTLSGSDDITVVDAGGALLFTAAGTLTGTRIRAF